MVKTLQTHGNSQALVIDKSIMETIGITVDTPLQITISGSTLIITPIHVGIGRKRISASIKKLRPKYSKMLKNLAK